MAKTLRWMAPKPARYGGFKGALISLFFFFKTDLKLLLFFLNWGQVILAGIIHAINPGHKHCCSEGGLLKRLD